MTSFRPCFGCTARNDCEIKKSAVKALRGQPVTLAKIKCDLPWTKHFPPGTRALVKVWDHRNGDQYDESNAEEMMVPATVVGKSSKKPGKLLLHLDAKIMTAQETEIAFRAAWPKEIRKLDEPLAELCSSCGRALVHGKCEHPEDFYDFAVAS
jgi:hypothetical protein